MLEADNKQSCCEHSVQEVILKRASPIQNIDSLNTSSLITLGPMAKRCWKQSDRRVWS